MLAKNVSVEINTGNKLVKPNPIFGRTVVINIDKFTIDRYMESIEYQQLPACLMSNVLSKTKSKQSRLIRVWCSVNAKGVL